MLQTEASGIKDPSSATLQTEASGLDSIFWILLLDCFRRKRLRLTTFFPLQRLPLLPEDFMPRRRPLGPAEGRLELLTNSLPSLHWLVVTPTFLAFAAAVASPPFSFLTPKDRTND
ncbi:hypothetical protein PTTG_29899 [Puccinia triticina 1-1 BBBD Race 1]|uniref:Transmembrane protein n=1 Tax=Puccinia triticina (isolate 1-1 / race 1 (BBBD)) TaxID=630390 RepID=A0A180G3P7_PUCT1|nr:hypothetical protein PTTG_29899 [Puccinia triticina 1-1 BBBD Race 1]